MLQKTIFHVHSYRCRHASKELDEAYIKRAIELEAERIVFTDHAPFPGEIFNNRMSMKEFEEYLDTLRNLKLRYSNKIDVCTGIEIEYIETCMDYYKMLINSSKIDFLLLGQHFSAMPSGKYSFELEDTHEPIVTKEEFLTAQDMLRKVKKSKKNKSKNDNVFVCPYCGYKLQKTYGKDTYYSCSHVRYTGNKDCKKIYWSKTKLEEVLYHLFSAQAKLYLTETAKQETKSINREILKKKKSSLQYLKQSYASLNLKKSELYDKYKDGYLDRAGFIKEKERYTDESIRVKKQIEEAESELLELQTAIQELEVRKADEEHMNHLLNLPEDRLKEMMYTSIDEVQIFDSETIRVKWNFSDGLQMVS